MFAPAGTPTATIAQIDQAMAKALQQPDVRQRLTQMGLTVEHMGPEVLAKRERAYTQTWARIIQDSGFQPQ